LELKKQSAARISEFVGTVIENIAISQEANIAVEIGSDSRQKSQWIIESQGRH
jgi:hypothetical protein